MTVNILAIGKLKEEFYRSALAEYIKRIGRFAKINVIELPESMQHGDNDKEISKVIEQESSAILAKLKGYVIAMDLSGKMVSSNDIADELERKMSEGVSEFTYVIGGSNGMSREVVARADNCYSFGKVTYPHQLMRVLVAEQIYRAFMINAGADYHK